MRPLYELFARAGPVMIAILALSVVLYARCFQLLIWLRSQGRQLRAISGLEPAQVPAIHRRQQELLSTFREHRIALGAMIAAAPLLGLLGTVSGMVKTFESLADRAGQSSIEGLAQGISEVLLATESGLAVAIPATLLVYLAHRAVHRNIQRMNDLEEALNRVQPS
jgi:biopolymer transport protein ExbB